VIFKDKRGVTISTTSRRVFRWVLAIGFVLVLAAILFISWYVQTLAPRVKQRVVSALQDRFDAEVTLKSLQLSLFPHPKAVGEELSIRHKGWDDPDPLLYIHRFSAETDFWTLIDRRNHVTSARLIGLAIHIPSRGRASLKERIEGNHEVASDEPGSDQTHLRFLIDTIIADQTLLEIEPKIAGKDPLEFEIRKLTMHPVGPKQAMSFRAVLINAEPPGLIESNGSFGPWQKDDPRSTAVSGGYLFQHADLGVFKGIAGTLASTGTYGGVLQHIEVNGTTDVPNFALKGGRDTVHLKTKFHSIVNGTDGDTLLDPVDARFLQSEFICRGGVVHMPGEPGKTVSLDATAPHARMEDILKLVMGGTPVVSGNVDFASRIVIPPGAGTVLDRLRLDGRFALLSANFTSRRVAQRLLILSNRARGISKSEAEQGQGPDMVASNLRGRFSLGGSTARFSELSFQVPGALIRLKGSYGVQSEKIDMSGTFRMQATLSQTQSGVKQLLLMPFNKLFEKGGAGFEAPITITGTRDHPEIGISVLHHQFTVH
jgi:hypothetical protein